MNITNPPHWILNSCFGAFLIVWVHLGPFRYCKKLGAKRAECAAITAKVHATKSHRTLRTEYTRSTPLDPILMFCCVSKCLGAFGTFPLLYDTWFRTGQIVAINAKVRATKSC